MEYIDDDSRPRFQFQARPSPPTTIQNPNPPLLKINPLHAFACFAAALLLLVPIVYLSNHQSLTFILIWTSLSLIAGPFAPPSLTGGDPRVGLGDPLPHLDLEVLDDLKKKPPGRRPKSHPPAPPPPGPSTVRSIASEKTPPIINGSDLDVEEDEEEEEKEWNDEDFEILKKQIGKHPVGAPRRWERIAEAFRGRHGVESVIRTAKSMSEKRPGAEDSFAQFLKQRKPLDKRAEGVNGDLDFDVKKEIVNWSAGEDIALLNALKAFPKDVPLRWEKIAAGVPGKTKACCVKRVAELKRDFRSSKASET